MEYLLNLFLLGLVLGLVGVASNPAPFFAALGLVLVSGAGCGVLVGHGGSLLSLMLFLIYLGGMLVVFAYSAALAAEPFPESWGARSVKFYVFLYVLGVAGGSWGMGISEWGGYLVVDEYKEFFVVRGDFNGVALMYSFGGMLVTCAWALLLSLFVVLEVTRGLNRGALRAV